MVRIPKEDFFGYDTKFTSLSGKDWLLLDSICRVFPRKSLYNKEICREEFA